VILVGGGTLLIARPLRGVVRSNTATKHAKWRTRRAAISLVHGCGKIFDFAASGPGGLLAKARKEAGRCGVACGAAPDTVEVVDIVRAAD